MNIVYCILYSDIGDEINNSIIYFVQTNYSSCCSYLKYHFPKYLIFNAHGINRPTYAGIVTVAIIMTVCGRLLKCRAYLSDIMNLMVSLNVNYFVKIISLVYLLSYGFEVQ